ncbi:MAG: hypothetical protein O2970_11950 [Proteobacteria bacterium]|nr:hypothetical protein [Pseudomonadota bacterium]MDA0967650.1 hypothetical protein [Pseudomonadota bacterium]MDG4544514.1 hypothetical protein [Rickettsiales bacterium]
MEEFFKNYQYTFSAFGAVGTLLAVIISLYFGYRALKTQQTQIKAFLNIYELTEPNTPEYLAVNITNVGLIAVSISSSFFCFRLPFSTTAFLVIPLDSGNSDINIPSKSYPHKIEPKHCEFFILNTLDSLVLKNIKGWLVNFIRAEVHTSDGSILKVKVSKDIKNEIKKNLKR